jgi:sec-independent protein translocase protein TatA
MGLTDILQPTHLLIILVVALLVLGPKRLPEVGRSLGKSMRDFKDAISGVTQDTPEPTITPPAPAPEPARDPVQPTR